MKIYSFCVQKKEIFCYISFSSMISCPDSSRFLNSKEMSISKTVAILSVIDSNPINVNIGNDKYTVVKSSKLLVAPINSVESTVKIDNIEVPAFTIEKAKLTIKGLKDNDVNIKYAVYENGEYNYYKYDTVENTFQYFETENSASTNNLKIFIVTTIVFAITTLGFGGYLLYSKRKKKRIKLDLSHQNVKK